jgi:hypothetical protein
VRAGYLDISIDVCDITAAVDAGNWTTAAEIYENGKNSVRGDGSLRTFLAWATTDAVDEPYWGLYSTFFNDSAWINTFVAAGLEGEEPYTADGERGQVGGWLGKRCSWERACSRAEPPGTSGACSTTVCALGRAPAAADCILLPLLPLRRSCPPCRS